MDQTEAIPFHIPYQSGKELEQIRALISAQHYAYPTAAHQQCFELLTTVQQSKYNLLTTACTAALEIITLLLEIKAGDEVILPAFAYPSMANAFALRGAKIIFVDVDPNTMNIDPACIEPAISTKTKGIVVMHYGSVACEMESILAIAGDRSIPVVEDAAHCIGATYGGRSLGTFGTMGALSFHSTKNIHCIQGGALLLKHETHLNPALQIAEKGTDKFNMRAGSQNHYSWTSLGSSYLMSSLNAAFLAPQLDCIDAVNQARRQRWNYYVKCFEHFDLKERLQIIKLKPEHEHNAHLFFIKCKNKEERSRLIQYLRMQQIDAYFHYLPLHTSRGGKKFGFFKGKDIHTTLESERLLRLPIYPTLPLSDIERITACIYRFYQDKV